MLLKNRRSTFLFPNAIATWLVGTLFSISGVTAVAAPSTTLLQYKLVITTGSGAEGEIFESFNSNSGELGADQEVVSSGSGYLGNQQHRSYTSIGLDLTGYFVPVDGEIASSTSGNRWTDADPDHVTEPKPGDIVGISDFLPGARPLVEPPDYSGNVAITGTNAGFSSQNTDYFASTGFTCKESPENCYISNNPLSNSFFSDDTSDGINLDELSADSGGVSQSDPAALLDELGQWRDFINNLAAETTIKTKVAGDNSEYKYEGGALDGTIFSLKDQNFKDSGSPVVTDLDVIDADGDGFAVIDIDLGQTAFAVNTSDWILKTERDVVAIFRMKSDSIYNFDNSSIMMGPGCEGLGVDANNNPVPCTDDPIQELGAIFVYDFNDGTPPPPPSVSTNEVFNLDNVILGGVALWDLDDRRNTILNLNNVQGCTQLISSKVELSSHNRLNRCSSPGGVAVPEPSTLALFLLGVMGTTYTRRRKTA